MEKARCNTELYSNLRGPLNNVKPSNFWGSHHLRNWGGVFILMCVDYSHSIVAGGFELMSYTTRFTPCTLLMMSFDTLARNS